MSNWIKKSERAPTAEDADGCGCIWIYMGGDGENCGTGNILHSPWNTESLHYYTHWMPTGMVKPVKPESPRPREWWINLYEVGRACVHPSQIDADDTANPHRKERVHVREVLP